LRFVLHGERGDMAQLRGDSHNPEESIRSYCCGDDIEQRTTIHNAAVKQLTLHCTHCSVCLETMGSQNFLYLTLQDTRIQFENVHISNWKNVASPE